MPYYRHYFPHPLRYLKLLYQVISLTRTTVSGLFTTKLSLSKLISLRSVVTRSISLLKNVTISESICNNIIRVYIIIKEYNNIKSFKHFIQSGKDFIAGGQGQALTALSHISWVLCLSRQNLSIKCSFETTLLHI